MDARWLSTWHIIYCTHSEFITWQLVAKIFLDFFFFFYSIQKITSELLKDSAFFTHYYKRLYDKRKTWSLSIACISVQFVDWFIDFPFFPPTPNSEQIAYEDLWTHLDECVRESIYILNGNITFPFPRSTDCLWVTINTDAVKTSPKCTFYGAVPRSHSLLPVHLCASTSIWPGFLSH